jgi:hypothetical protein
MANFPQIILRGEGTAPFVIRNAHRISLSGEIPEQTLVLRNSIKTPVSVTLSGIPSMIRGDRHIELPPMGESTVTLSIEGTEFAPDYLGRFRIAATSGAFREFIDLQITGPKAPPKLELLRGGDLLACKIGMPLRLEGVARNPTDTSRTVELSFVEQGASNNPSANTLVLPPKGAVNFHNDWIPDSPGNREIAVELREQGRLLERQSWHVTVGIAGASLPLPAPSPAGRESSQDTPHVLIAPPKTTQKLVVNLRPGVQYGWFLDHVTLQWSYLGNDRPGFRIQTLQTRSTIADRTGERAPEEWIDVEGLAPAQQLGKGQWSVALPFLMPGCHTFRVFPVTSSEVLVAPITIQISSRTAYWAPVRATLVIILIILILGIIRRRLY